MAQAPDDVINSNGDLAFGKQMTLSLKDNIFPSNVNKCYFVRTIEIYTTGPL